MTEHEAIKDISENIKPYAGGKSLNMAIEALEEVQQYRAIGTPEECRAAVEKQIPHKTRSFNNSWRKGYTCRCCNNEVSYYSNYCSNCGQKLDFGE